jgi:hypothetical protein
MKLLLFFLIPLWSFSQTNIQLPQGFINESVENKYTLIYAPKYNTQGDIEALIELKYSDDWSFSLFSNDEYIEEFISTDKFESSSGLLFNDFEIHIKEKINLLGVGKCFYSIYSGSTKSNNTRIANVIIQFIKNDRLYTLVGSTFPERLRDFHQDFLKSFDSLTL